MKYAFLLVVMLVSTIALAAEPSEKPVKKELISIAVLLSAPRQIDADQLRPRLAKRFGIELGKTRQDDDTLVQFRANMIAVQLKGQRFGIITSPDPYSAKDAAWLDDADPRISGPFKKHVAWMSVDWFPTENDQDKAAAYRRIGQMISELLGDDCLLLYGTEKKQLVWLHEKTKALLESDEPVNAIKIPDPPITKVKADDPRMIAAVKKAKETWPEFTAAFAKRAKGDTFVIKSRFADEHGTEWMWSTVVAIDGETIRGRLNNHPAAVQNIKLGESVTVAVNDLNDWLIVRDGKMTGGYTIEVMKAVQADAEKAK